MSNFLLKNNKDTLASLSNDSMSDSAILCSFSSFFYSKRVKGSASTTCGKVLFSENQNGATKGATTLNAETASFRSVYFSEKMEYFSHISLAKPRKILSYVTNHLVDGTVSFYKMLCSWGDKQRIMHLMASPS